MSANLIEFAHVPATPEDVNRSANWSELVEFYDSHNALHMAGIFESSALNENLSNPNPSVHRAILEDLADQEPPMTPMQRSAFLGGTTLETFSRWNHMETPKLKPSLFQRLRSRV